MNITLNVIAFYPPLIRMHTNGNTKIVVSSFKVVIKHLKGTLIVCNQHRSRNVTMLLRDNPRRLVHKEASLYSLTLFLSRLSRLPRFLFPNVVSKQGAYLYIPFIFLLYSNSHTFRICILLLLLLSLIPS